MSASQTADAGWTNTLVVPAHLPSAILPIVRVGLAAEPTIGPGYWPRSLQAVEQFLGGFELGQMTILVGDNGTGKSTLVEALAMAYGLNVEGGSTGARHHTHSTESELFKCMKLTRGIGASREGYFLRAETMHSFYTYLEENPSRTARNEPNFHAMSHGESFLKLLERKFTPPGLFLLDEPESALSFSGCLALLRILSDLIADRRAQVVMATHSPVLASMPNADLYELDDSGITRKSWNELDFVQNYRRFLERPEQYHRLVFDD